MTTETLINALIRAQKRIDHTTKDAKNPFFKSGYATLQNVFDTVKPALNEEGIYIQQVSHEREGGVCIETIFMGHGGSVSSGQVFVPAPKNDPQAYGSAVSYAKRYSLQMACGIATTDEDDDAEKAMQRTKPATQVKRPKKKTHDLLNAKGGLLKKCDSPIDVLNTWKEEFGDPDDSDHKAMFDLNYEVMKRAFSTLDEDSAEYSEAIELSQKFKGEAS